MEATYPRKCVYVTQHPDQELIEMLNRRGCEIVIAESPAAASGMLDGSLLGGVLDVSRDYSPHMHSELEECLSIPGVGWVVCVSPEQLSSPCLRRLISNYCHDYITMPCAPLRIADSLGHAYGMAMLIDRPESVRPDRMIGESDAMQHLFRTINKVATTSAPVFISGESGTGKELTAAAIHAQSSRSANAFVAINCGAIPHSLVQSELYGYEKGSFTGANQRRIGRIEAANGGTLFLDEIGDLPLESQASLLRFLQEGQIERLGGTSPIDVDVRIISATHVDIETAVAEGRFRSDLYHRLCVLRIDEPPLRARGADIELLARHTLERFKADNNRRIAGFSSAAVEALYNYDWPGNVRELINRVRRATVMADGRVITPEDLELENWATPKAVTLAQAREEAEQAAIQQALLRHRNRLNDAATELGISRVTLYRLLDSQRKRNMNQTDGSLRTVA